MEDRPDLPDALGELLPPRYRILSELGRGGTAFVYLAEDLKHRRRVAIKVLRPEVAHALGPDRFLREIRIAAGLSHPNIVGVIDSGQVAGTLLYYVMPFVEGESLRARLDREGPLPLPDTVAIIGQVASALDHAHAQQIVHRDLKPENILLAQDGRALVADFGVARAFEQAEAGGLTEPGLAVGTPSYMSPEQAAADPRIDARSDVYGLGIVAYEMLTGEPPFRSASPRAVLARKMTDEIPPIRSVREGAPPAVEAVVLRALARVPGDRYGSAGAFASALEAAAAGRDAGLPGSVRRPSRPVLVAFGLMTLFFLAGWFSLRGQQGDDVAAERADRPIVAVLPFETPGRSAADSLFAAGMHSEILTQLQRLGSIGVVGYTSTRLQAQSGKTTAEIARELDAGALLQATIVRTENRFRMNARLTDGATGLSLWAEAYEDSLTIGRFFDVQEDVALRVAGALEVALSVEERERLTERPEPSEEAYEHYVAGNLHYRNGRWAQALASFDSAVAADRDYAPARAAVARAAAIYWFMGGGHGAGERARAALDSARRLAPGAPETHMADGLVSALIDGAYDRASRSFEIALQSLPNDSDLLYWLNVSYTLPLRLDSAAAIIRRAYRLDPDHSDVAWQRGFIPAIQWKFREASRYFDRAALQAPEHPMIFDQRWVVYMWGLGDTVTARSIAENAPASIPRGAVLDKLAWLAYVSRNPTALGEIVDSMSQFAGLRFAWSIRLHGLLGNESARRAFADSLLTLALADFENAQSLGATPEGLEATRARLALAHAWRGDTVEALRTIRLAVERVEQQHDRLNMQETYLVEALTYAALGMSEVGIQRLDSIFAGRSPLTITPFQLRVSPDFDGLRRDPAFSRLLAEYERRVER